MHMSRTDKDRPYWVVMIQDSNGRIDHDHRHGECIEDSLEYEKWANGSQYRFGRHHHCKKNVWVTEYCTKDEPNTKFVWDSLGSRRVQTCWTWVCTCPDGMHTIISHCRKRVQCDGHSKRIRDNDIPCSCDDYLPAPTCAFHGPDDTRGGWRRYTWGGVPTWYCREVYHRPERARERGLRDMAREYNTYGDIEDDDFENRQARNSARWLWW